MEKLPVVKCGLAETLIRGALRSKISCMSPFVFSAALVAVSLANVQEPVENAHLKRAEALLFDFKYDDALKALGKALSVPENSRANLLKILELRGVAAGQLRQTKLSEDSFLRLLTLEPEYKLQGDYAPRVMTPYFEAKRQVSERGSLVFRAGKPTVAGDEVVAVSVELPTDPMTLARSVRFHLRGPSGDWRTLTSHVSSGKATADVGQLEVSWWAEVRGENEAQLELVGSEAAPLVAAARTAVAAAPEPRKAEKTDLTPAARPEAKAAAPELVVKTTGGGLRTVSYGVLGAAAVAGGVGAYFGLQASAAQGKLSESNLQRDSNGVITNMSELDYQRWSKQAGDSGKLANTLFVAAGALAVGGVVSWVVGGPVAVSPLPGGVVIAGKLP